MPIISIEKFLRGGYVIKKSYLAAAAILGAAVFAGQAHAVKIDLGKGKSFKMGFRAKVHAVYLGKAYTGDKSDIAFSVPNARIYGKGSISKIFKWGWQGDFRPNDGNRFRIVDAFVMLDFAKEFKVYAGWIKLPFELHSGIQSGWSFVAPTGPAYGLAQNPFTNPAATRAQGSGSRSPQVGVWGKVAGGMFKYYLYATDGVDQNNWDERKTGYGVRVEFAPTMVGYKGHPGYVLKETYLGKQNTFVVGLSYFAQKQDQDTGNPGGTTSAKSFAVDILWEQNLGAVTPNISLGYVSHKDFRGNCADASGVGDTVPSCGDAKGFLAQAQVLFNQNTILGKPAVGIRWAQSDPDDFVDDGQTINRYKSSVIGVVGQLYVKGVGNRIALSVDRVKYDQPGAKDYTDVTLALWYNF